MKSRERTGGGRTAGASGDVGAADAASGREHAGAEAAAGQAGAVGAAGEADTPGGRVRTAPPIVLASQSPRRAQLMELIGLSFEVEPADVDETYLPHEAPPDHARRLAEKKALVVSARRPESLVVGSDTVVIVDGDVLGKPADEREALEMLMRLQGREHEVLTGVAVAAPGAGAGVARAGHGSAVGAHGSALGEHASSVGGPLRRGGALTASGAGKPNGVRLASGVEAVRVRFRAFDQATALEYIATGEPMDKAGAYGIQGFGATIVECIEGDYFAVMGLAIGRMIGLFRKLGWRYNFRGLEPM